MAAAASSWVSDAWEDDGGEHRHDIPLQVDQLPNIHSSKSTGGRIVASAVAERPAHAATAASAAGDSFNGVVPPLGMLEVFRKVSTTDTCLRFPMTWLRAPCHLAHETH